MLRHNIATVLLALLASRRIQAFSTIRSNGRRHFPPTRRMDPTALAATTASNDEDVNEYYATNDNVSSLVPQTSGLAPAASNPLSSASIASATPNTMMIKGYDPSEGLPESVNVGDPQLRVAEKERSVTSILRELVAIQQKGPQKYCILGTRHCSYMHQQIIELL